MIEVALVGCAHVHTPGFINTLKSRDDIHVKYVWDHEIERAERRAAELGTQAVTEVDTIWQDPAVTGAVICSETNRHEALVLAGAAAKKHLFVEKPLGMGAKDAFAMAKAITRAGVIFQTGYFMRSQPHHLFLRRQIAQGHFGKITRIRHTNCHSGSLGGWFDTEWRWMADPAIAGVGAFGDLGTHSLDVMLWMMDNPVVSVTGKVAIATGRYGDCDEYGEALLQFANGAVGTIAAGWVDLANPASLHISGTEGYAYLADDGLHFKSSHVSGADGGVWTDLPAALPHAFSLFLNAIAGENNLPLVTVNEAAVRSAVMEAIYQGIGHADLGGAGGVVSVLAKRRRLFFNRDLRDLGD